MGARVQKKQKNLVGKTYVQRPSEVERSWWVIDASEMPLGRLASEAAKLISGRYKVSYTPNVDGGDYVVIINADNLVVTGAKVEDKMYRRHSGYMGGLKELNMAEVLRRDPGIAIEQAVCGMLPKNKLRPEMMKRLKTYKGLDHKHVAQNPKKFSFNK